MADRKASYEVLERLARAVDVHVAILHESDCIDQDLRTRSWDDVREHVSRYRAAVRPLRTETEVVLDIGHHVRACVRRGQFGMTSEEEARLEELANEETAPREQTAPEPDHAQELDDPDPCSCDESLALRAQVDRIRALAQLVGGSTIPTRAERALQEILEVLG